jgi:ProP effector
MTDGKRYANAIALIELLAGFYPATFFVRAPDRRPLKIGIYQDVIAAHPEIDRADLRLCFRVYCGHPLYLRSCKAGADRIDLAGNVSGLVTTEQAAGCKARRQAMNAKQKAAAQARRDQAAAIAAKASGVNAPEGGAVVNEASVSGAAVPARRLGLGDLKRLAAQRRAVA